MLAADLGIPTGDFASAFNIGPGVMGKFLFGVSDAGQISGTTGITFYGAKSGIVDPPGVKVTFRIIPLLLGYRHNFNGLFVEPQVGMGIYGATATYMGQSGSDSDNAFTWAVGFGYAKDKLEAGIRYQSGEKDGSLSLVGIHIGYNFSLGSGK